MVKARKHILVVEDYQQLRDLMQTVLQELGGHAVHTAADADNAERLIAEQWFDLVLLDIGLPGKPAGRDIAVLARARLQCPILFITGRELAEVDCWQYIDPRDRFLRKPFKMDVLITEVRSLLKANAAKAPDAPTRRRPPGARAKPVAAR